MSPELEDAVSGMDDVLRKLESMRPGTKKRWLQEERVCRRSRDVYLCLTRTWWCSDFPDEFAAKIRDLFARAPKALSKRGPDGERGIYKTNVTKRQAWIEELLSKQLA